MSETQTVLLHHRTVFDGWRSISVAIYMALVGYSVMVAIPVISSAWVDLLGFTEVQADPDWVGQMLVYTSVFSVIGCACATLISNRFGLARPLLVTLVAQAIIVVMLAGGINNINVMISMFAFNFCWIFVDIYQSATIANIDHTGRFAALMPGAQGLGQIIGPNLAASRRESSRISTRSGRWSRPMPSTTR